MKTSLAIFALSIWVPFLVLLGGGLLAGLWYRVQREKLHRLSPRAREKVLWAWAMTPWWMAAWILLGCFLPSFMDWMGWGLDDCQTHLHRVHLCFHHGEASPLSLALGAWMGWILLGVGMAGISWVRSTWTYLQVVGGLRVLSQKVKDRGFVRVATRRPLALTLGILEPEVFLSEGLEDSLSDREFEAVLSHERAHQTRKDGLRKLLFSALAFPVFPPLRRPLIEDLTLATESICDRIAADEIQSPALVAQALLASTRLEQSWARAESLGTCHLLEGQVTQRVRALLDPHWDDTLRIWFLSFAGLHLAGFLFSFGFAQNLHHLVETLLARIF